MVLGYVGCIGRDDVSMWIPTAHIAGFAAAQGLEHRFTIAAPAINR